LDRSRFDCVLIGIDEDGRWYLQDLPDPLTGCPGDRLALAVKEDRLVWAVPGGGLATAKGPVPADFVFPVLHGTFGEDGTVQGLLELTDLPYAGPGVLGSAVGMDKATTKMLWSAAGLPVVEYKLLYRGAMNGAGGEGDSPSGGTGRPRVSVARLARELSSNLGDEVFVKPSAAGSSVGVHLVDLRGGTNGLEGALEDAFRYDTKVLVERKIMGREIECSVRGFSDLESSVPGEIVPNHPFYDYKAKYIDPDGARLCIPAELDPGRAAEVRELAREACRLADIRGMARVDFLLEETTGKPYLNEVNTIPGFTSISMYPLLFEAEGLSYRDLLTGIIEDGFARYEERKGLVYRYDFTND
jgi:D-alanine-D-alanine ligase